MMMILRRLQKKSKSQNLRRPGHQRHRPETKAKIDLFKKIRSSEKIATEIKRSPEELKLWDSFKSGKCSVNGMILHLVSLTYTLEYFYTLLSAVI